MSFKKYLLFIYMLVPVALTAQLNITGLAPGRQAAAEPISVSISRITPENRDTLTISLLLQMEKNIHVYSAESLFFKIDITGKQGLDEEIVTLPESRSFTNFDKSVVDIFVDGQSIILKHPIRSDSWSLEGTIRYQACDSALCFTPRTISFFARSTGELSVGNTTPGAAIPVKTDESLEQFTFIGSTGGFLNVERFSGFLRNPAGSTDVQGRSEFENRGIFIVILLILLGGLALNLTPCVLPMIPITLAVIGAGSQASSRRQGLVTGAVYGLAMALTYGILGMIVILTGTRFGVINSSPYFNVTIAVVFVIMALAMFDVINVDFTKFRRNTPNESRRGKLLTSFMLGIVTSLLAGACVAPVVISVVIYSTTLYSAGNPVGIALPLLLGTGMALPWPFAGAGLSFLPKPGKWMVWIKHAFGIFILLMALYYGYTAINLFKNSAPHKTVSAAQSEPSSLPWIHSLGEGVQRSLQEGKPLFIDFWATWCKNCSAMDATTFRDPGVQKLMQEYVLVKYQAERPDDPETKKILDRFHVVGLPTYVILEPGR